MKLNNRQISKQVIFALEFVNILNSDGGLPCKNASSVFLFSGHGELETGLLSVLLYKTEVEVEEKRKKWH